jgi:hypothetical protein
MTCRNPIMRACSSTTYVTCATFDYCMLTRSYSHRGVLAREERWIGFGVVGSAIRVCCRCTSYCFGFCISEVVNSTHLLVVPFKLSAFWWAETKPTKMFGTKSVVKCRLCLTFWFHKLRAVRFVESYSCMQLTNHSLYRLLSRQRY